jgi:predicted metalloendopeptidase
MDANDSDSARPQRLGTICDAPRQGRGGREGHRGRYRRKVEAAGLKPVKADLAAIRSARSLDDVARLMGRPELAVGGPMSLTPWPDAANPDRCAWCSAQLVGADLACDPDSPAIFRVNGVVRNMDAWYTAFDIKPGDRLYCDPKDRVRIW